MDLQWIGGGANGPQSFPAVAQGGNAGGGASLSQSRFRQDSQKQTEGDAFQNEKGAQEAAKTALMEKKVSVRDEVKDAKAASIVAGRQDPRPTAMLPMAAKSALPPAAATGNRELEKHEKFDLAKKKESSADRIQIFARRQ